MHFSRTVKKFPIWSAFFFLFFSSFPFTITTSNAQTTNFMTTNSGPCGKTFYTLKDEPITITSPNYPNNYGRNEDCQWLVETEPGLRISIGFTHFSTENDLDVLNAGNGLSPSVPTAVVVDHGGDSLPKNFTTRDNQAWLTFVSDSTIQRSGFRVIIEQTNDTTCENNYYECLDGTCIPDQFICDGISDCQLGEDEEEDCQFEDPCGEWNVTLNDEPVYLRSPYYPYDYPNNLNCKWVVTTQQESNILVHFNDFRTIDEEDFMSAGNGNDPTDKNTILIDEYSSRLLPPGFVSRGNIIWFNFTTNNAGRERGFEAVLTKTNLSNCEENEYECSNSICISNSFLCDGQVDCISGEDEPNNCPGFFNYTLYEKGGFSTPNFPDRGYSPDQRIHWLLQASVNNSVKLSFQSFMLQKDFYSPDPKKSCPNHYDTVTVYDGPSEFSDLLGVFCGAQIPPVTQSSGEFMLVIFQSDQYIEDMGFFATFSSTDETLPDATDPPVINCGEMQTIGNDPVIIHSLNYPEPYNNSLRCYWELKTENDYYKFYIKFLDFDSEEGRDIVQVGNGAYSFNNTNDVIINHSGPELPNPSNFITSSNLMYLSFITDYSENSYRGFKVEILRVNDSFKFTTLSPPTTLSPDGCGKLRYTLEEDGHVVVLTSPDFPENYPNQLGPCTWIVEAIGNSKILVNFTDFNTDSGDVLSAGNGQDPSNAESVVIDNFSGSNLPNDFIATSDAVWITFESDRLVSASGFRIEFTLTNLTSLICSPEEFECKTYMTCIPSAWLCDGRHDCPLNDDEMGCENITPIPRYSNYTLATKGELSSPFWPDRTYLPDTEIEWLLDTQDANFYIILEFDYFDLQNDIVVTDPKKSCPNNFDTVKLYDGATVDSLLLGVFCGSKLPQLIRSSAQYMLIVFSSDSFIEERGFHANFSSSAANVPKTTMSPTPKCGEYLSLDSSETLEITTPGYPRRNYSNSARCLWQVETSLGERIKIEFDDFHSELGRDFLMAGNGLEPSTNETVIGPHSGQGLPDPAGFVSTGNSIFIVFTSDYSINSKGFHSVLKVVCSSSEYECPSNGVCIPDDYKCDGRGDCPFSEDEVGCPTVPGNLNYTLDDEGILKTSYWPDRTYLPNTEIQWLLRAQSHHRIVLEFHDFNLQTDVTIPNSIQSCPNDYDTVKIYDGHSTLSPPIGVFCGSETPPNIQSTGQNMLVIFKSDNFIEETGFYANFTSTDEDIFTTTMKIPFEKCGEDLTILDTESQITFTTPNFPNNYPNDLRCLWRIETNSDYRIDVQFIEFSSEKGRDIMSAGNGLQATNNTVISQHSGPDLPPRFVTVGNALWLSFISDYSVNKTGFQVTLTRTNASAYLPSTAIPTPESCVKSIIIDDESEEIFSSPNYPARYPNNLKCQWNVSTSKDLKIYLTFNDFHTELDFDILIAGHGLDPSNLSSVMVNHSGDDLPQGFISEENGLYVTFSSDSSIRDTGFEISVTSYKAKCMKEEFDCGNGQCVPESAVCNRTNECSNNFDEAGCIYPTSPLNCSSKEYKCRIGIEKCIPEDWVCDGHFDCYGKDDELNCPNIPAFSNQTIQETGTFSSPYYPRTYLPDTILTWVLEAAENQRCQLTFPDFHLQRDTLLPQPNNCPNDYDTVTIYDGNTMYSRVIGVYCGSIVPEQITSSGQSLLVVFKSDNYVEETGFFAEFSSAYINEPLPTEVPGDTEKQGAAAVETWTWVVVCIAIVAVIACIGLIFSMLKNKNKGTSVDSEQNLKSYDNVTYEEADPASKEKDDKTTHL